MSDVRGRARTESLPRSAYGSIGEYVDALEGRRAIRRVLIANNGISAVKCIRSIRRWAYQTFGNEREVRFTVMATPEDLRANAEYIRLADEFVEVPGGTNNNNYANVKLICELAESSGVDAVWAGWGHASEKPELPDGLKEQGIVFIGPSSGPMRALGDKIGSTIIAQSAGVPTIAWNGDGVTVRYAEEGLPDAVYKRGCVETAEEAAAAAERIGFPVMIKASEGGGGKGIRKVSRMEDLPTAFRQVQSELPGSPIFVMRMASRARHLEVQVLADEYGQAIALAGRDCSVQRRHQKIIEEGPPIAAPRDVFREMERAAVRLAKEVGYSNAGTVEYLFGSDIESASSSASKWPFAFLELNPRLQVEHPVTEMITNVNLPAAQLQVAMGIPLHRIPDVRKLYGQDPYGDAPIDFDNVEANPPEGHVIACRITAENPESGFQPTSGAVTQLNFRSTPDVWGYFSVDSSGRVHEFADSQIGHLFAWGRTREEARRSMVVALKELSIRGEIRTTIEFLIYMLESRDYVANRFDTQWLDGLIAAKVSVSKPDAALVAVMGAIAQAFLAFSRRFADFSAALERGQAPSDDLLAVTEPVDLIYNDVKYTFQVTQSGPTSLSVVCNGSAVQSSVRKLSDGGLLVALGHKSHVLYTREEASGLRLLLDGCTCMFTREYDPSRICAAVSGKLVRYLVADGERVAAGQGFVEVEVMKMYMQVISPEAGIIRVVKPEGSPLEAGELIATCDLEDPSKVKRAELFHGSISHLTSSGSGGGSARAVGGGPLAASPAASAGTASSPAEVVLAAASRKAHILARTSMQALRAVLAGYVMPKDLLGATLWDRDASFANPHLPLLELEEALSVQAGRIPLSVEEKLSALVSDHRQRMRAGAAGLCGAASGPGAAATTTMPEVFPEELRVAVEADVGCDHVRFPAELNARLIAPILDEAERRVPQRERAAFQAATAAFRSIQRRYWHGVSGAGRLSLVSLLEDFLSVERLFGASAVVSQRPEDVLYGLRLVLMAKGGPVDPPQGIPPEAIPAYADAKRAADAVRCPEGPSGSGRNPALDDACNVARAHAHLAERIACVRALLDRVAEEIERGKQILVAAGHQQGQGRRVLAATTVAPPGTTTARGVAASAGAGGGVTAFASFSEASAAQVGSLDDPLGRPKRPSVSEGSEGSPVVRRVAGAAGSGGSQRGASPHAPPPPSSYMPLDGKPPAPAWEREEEVLRALAELRGREYSQVALEARHMLMVAAKPSITQRIAVLQQSLNEFAALRQTPTSAWGGGGGAAGGAASPALSESFSRVMERASGQLKTMLRTTTPLVDVLMLFFAHPEAHLRQAAVEVYIRRLYRAYHVRDFAFSAVPNSRRHTALAADEVGLLELDEAGGGAGGADTATTDEGGDSMGVGLARSWSEGLPWPVAHVLGVARRVNLVGVGTFWFSGQDPSVSGARSVTGSSRVGKRSAGLAASGGAGTGMGAGVGAGAGTAAATAAAVLGVGGSFLVDSAEREHRSSFGLGAGMNSGDSYDDLVALGATRATEDRDDAESSDKSDGDDNEDEEEETNKVDATTSPPPMDDGMDVSVPRLGAVVVVDDVVDVAPALRRAAEAMSRELARAALAEGAAQAPPAAVNVVHVALLRPAQTPDADGDEKAAASDADKDEAAEREVVKQIERSVTGLKSRLDQVGIRRITFLIPNPRTAPVLRTPIQDASAHSTITKEVVPTSSASSSAGAAAASATGATAAAPASLRIDTRSAGSGSGSADGGRASAMRRIASFHVPDLATTLSSPGGVPVFSLVPTPAFPSVYTLRARLGLKEDPIVRHIEPPLSGYLELRRLSNFRIRLVPTPNRNIHVYEALEGDGGAGAGAGGGGGGGGGGGKGKGGKGQTRKRYFVRAMVRDVQALPRSEVVEDQTLGPEKTLVEAMDALAVAMGDVQVGDTSSPVGSNHIFLNILPRVRVEPRNVESILRVLAHRYSDRLRRLRVSQVEFKIHVLVPSVVPGATTPTPHPPHGEASPVRSATGLLGSPLGSTGGAGGVGGGGSSVLTAHSLGERLGSSRDVLGGGSAGGLVWHSVPMRLISSNPTGYIVRIESYIETPSPAGPVFSSIASGTASLLAVPPRAPGATSASYPSLVSLDTTSASGASGGAGGASASSMLASVGASKLRIPTQHLASLFENSASSPGADATPASAAANAAAAGGGIPSVASWLEALGLLADAGGAGAAAHSPGEWDGKPVFSPYPLTTASERKRAMAASSSDTLWVYDLPEIFQRALEHMWARHETDRRASGVHVARPARVLRAVELVLQPTEGREDPGGSIVDLSGWELAEQPARPMGRNTVGMVAWKMTLFTPEYAEGSGGRDVVVIANDITHQAGSFGTREDAVFALASAYARDHSLPRVYVAANSGARIGLAEEVKGKFRVAWADPADPVKGFRYLYLREDDYAALAASRSVRCQRVEEEGEVRFAITDVVGAGSDLGVENLRGSGMIAGAMSRAYHHEGFTLSYVTGRTVGIGAYLVRLGHRVIQKMDSSPIVLTGYQALNKLIGSRVYVSNDQLGGPKVMYANGIAHQLVHDDFEGALAVLEWLSFVPRTRHAPLPLTPTLPGDDPDRPVDFVPPATPYDPRLLLTGATASAVSAVSGDVTETHVTGLLDRGSFRETMGGWARTVVTGRARLGGIPLGVIVAELRTVVRTEHADPATATSVEVRTPQAGQVWFPDSAFKTAQAVRDFNGEELPLLVLANWRGFSGGQRDMFDEVLKFGSYIVDALVDFRQPVMVYVPPRGELRGGAWVVIDPTINEDVMEMYADPTARGGVLEPSGITAIKFRDEELAATARRLDPQLLALHAAAAAAAARGDADAAAAHRAAAAERERRLMGLYTQIAHAFADLHDTPGRMVAKGVIRAVVPWSGARRFLYWRLRRRLAEFALRRRLVRAAPQLSFKQAGTLLRQWFAEAVLAAEHSAASAAASASAAATSAAAAAAATSASPTASSGSGAAAAASSASHGAGGAPASPAARVGAMWEDDGRVLQWLSTNREGLETRAVRLRRESIVEQVVTLGLEDPAGAVAGVLALVHQLPAEHRELVVAALRRGVLTLLPPPS